MLVCFAMLFTSNHAKTFSYFLITVLFLSIYYIASLHTDILNFIINCLYDSSVFFNFCHHKQVTYSGSHWGLYLELSLDTHT